MPKIFCSLFAATVAVAPAPALAQFLAPEPPVAIVEPPPVAIVQPPLIAVPAAPLTEVDAAQIALMNGMAVVEDVDIRIWDGNFEVDGEDITGEDVVMRIDRATGQILSVDD